MLRPTALTASLLVTAALAPAAAGAASVHLGGQPSMHQTDATHARLQFAADRLPTSRSGAVAARVRIAGGRISGLTATGRHGRDVVYRARVTAPNGLDVGAKYTVRIEVPGQAPIVRLVKLHPAR
jgi:hypothetical protein